MNLSEVLLKGAVMRGSSTNPVWGGPSGEGYNGGVTQSLLSKFLSCPERFRLYVVEGLRTSDRYSKNLEYGNGWHVVEEHHAAGKDWQRPLEEYYRSLMRKYPLQQSDIEHWYVVCLKQFPLYVDFWSKHPDIVAREPLMQEQVFDVPYKLPSGRVVRLRGKFDSVDLVGKGANAGVWLMENKSKGEIDEEQIKRQMSCDLQVMLYITALKLSQVTSKQERRKRLIINGWRLNDGKVLLRPIDEPSVIRGVRFNCVRRPLSGGKGTIKQREATEGSKCSGCDGVGSRTMYAGTKREVYENPCSKCGGAGKTGAKPGETKEEFYDRLAAYIEQEPETYFMRWEVEVTDHDLKKFQREVLNPLLERLCQWWDWVSSNPKDVFAHHLHWKTPFGAYNSLAEGVVGDYDNFLQTGSRLGLANVDTLFRELV